MDDMSGRNYVEQGSGPGPGCGDFSDADKGRPSRESILAAEDHLSVDTERDEKKLNLHHQRENADTLSQAEGLLKDLFMDVDKAKRLGHPQAHEIEKDVKNLHDRGELYSQVKTLDPKQKIDWGPLLDDKMRQLKADTYGPKLPDVEKQMAEHNILHQEIEAYKDQLQPSSTSSKEQYAALKDKYDKLCELSQQRRAHLASLYEYVQSCRKELSYLSGQQERILQRDWSDAWWTPQCPHGKEVNKLQGEGERLVEKKHPASSTIKAHKDAVQLEWQAFLNLCLAQEIHLDNIEDYKKRLNSNLDPKALTGKSNPEVLMALELSSGIFPLKLRRTLPTKPTSVVALCDWADKMRGETLTLKSNSDNKNWMLLGSSGKTRTLPGTCFMVPPLTPRPWRNLDKALRDLKSRRSVHMSSLKNPTVEVVRPQKAVAVQSAPEDPRAAQLASEIDKINKALERNEKEVLNRLRSPLDNRNPTQDLNKRLQEHEKSALAVRKLESEKNALQREMEPILAKKPLGPTASSLPLKISMVSGFEEKLAKEGAIYDQPNALPSRNQQLQDVTAKKDEVTKLGRDLDLTEQSCSSLQRTFNEYCPDIRRQENEVKQLKNRYTSVNNQLQERSALVKQSTNKNQDFQNAVQGLDFFLLNLPNNAIKPTDDVKQITTKQNSQRKVVEDIKKKSDDLDRVKYLSRDLQSVLNEYDAKLNTYRCTLNEDDDDDVDYEEPVPKLRQTSTMAKAVQRKEKNLLNLFSEVTAENEQILNQLGTTKHIKARNEQKVSQVVVNQQMQLKSDRKDLEASDSLKKELNEEVARRLHAERDLETYRKRFERSGEVGGEEEVVQYYHDPKLELELQSLKSRIQDESLKRTRTRSEIEIISVTIHKLETQLISVEPRLVTKVMTEYERDPQLDKDAVRMREEIERIRLMLQTRDTEKIQVKTELTVLSQQKQKTRSKIIKKEVVRLEKDPQMLKSVLTFQTNISEEDFRSESLNTTIFSTRSQINTLERVIPTIQPKIVTKVVKQVQQDPKSLEESKKLRIALEEEKDENVILLKDLTTMLIRYGELEKLRPKVEVKEIINEIYRVDPETEIELVRLKKELQDSARNRTNLEYESKTLITTLTTLRSQKPKIEYKEVTQEVIKEEKSPEVTRELQRLNNQASRLLVNYETTIELLTRLRSDRDELKVEKSKVETKLVTKELIKYENDPLLEKEADRLRRNVREEVQQRRSVEELLFEIQNQYIVLERQKPEEKIVMREVVRLQKDPKQLVEHDKLNKNLDDELKARRKLDIEVRQLRALIQEKESTLAQMDERQKKIKVESELRQIKSRILELENAPPPVEERIIIEEILKVERDPKLDKLTDGIRADKETEANNISRIEREIRNLRIKLEILQKEKTIEKVVYREVVRVEKDPALEAEREHMRDLVMQERNLRRDQEDDTQNLHIRITHLHSSHSVTSEEETTLVITKDTMQREKEDLLRQLKMLEAQRNTITITFQQQSKLISERNMISKQRSLRSSSDLGRLEKEILNEKDKIHQRDTLIIELQSNVQREDHSETHTRR
ncbi:hypothetical protein F7725_004001 [Dissostichus mawsoni]|uniref:Envoplakin n=1 Tax=Dissostichus mawsoni TaxID=36200 RepID=A0A7J5YCS6_DISMA|nr:hypothetical protein F7725_004001 [Dissostichus mawsoni]